MAKKKINENLEDAIISMRESHDQDLTFYALFCAKIIFKSTDQIPTAGVNVDKKGKMNFFYNNDFINGLSRKQTIFLIIHEISHLICDHQKRTEKNNFDKKISNIVQDQIINSNILYHFPKATRSPSLKEEQKEDEALYLLEDYSQREYFEALYRYAIKKKDEAQQKSKQNPALESISKYHQDGTKVPNWDMIFQNSNEDQDSNTTGSSEGEESEGESESGDEKSEIKKTPSHPNMVDDHIEDEVDPDYRECVVDNVINGMKSRGVVSANVEDYINKLRSSKKDYLKFIKKNLSPLLRSNNKVSTYRKMNRKVKNLKGKKPMRGFHINCVLDSSGSMYGSIEKVLSYIFKKDVHINLVQCDTEVKSVNELKKLQDFRELKIKGFGGTVLQPALDHLKQHKNFSRLNTVILTDGMTDSLDISGIKGDVLVISNEKKCPIERKNGGKLRQVIVHEDDL